MRGVVFACGLTAAGLFQANLVHAETSLPVDVSRETTSLIPTMIYNPNISPKPSYVPPLPDGTDKADMLMLSRRLGAIKNDGAVNESPIVQTPDELRLRSSLLGGLGPQAPMAQKVIHPHFNINMLTGAAPY